MKKIILFSLLLMTTAIALAQSKSSQSKARLNVYGSYVFDDGFDVYNDANTFFNGTIKGGLQWGGGIEYLPDQHFSVELLYLNKNSDVPTTFKFGSAEPKRTETFDLTHHYILLAGNRLQRSSDGKIEGYGGLMAGVLISDINSPTTGKGGSQTDFTWGARLGLNYWVSDKIGLKFQTNMLTASKATGGDYYWSYWGPLYLNTYSTLWQFGLGAGLTFKLGN
jgi:hypothetical protein